MGDRGGEAYGNGCVFGQRLNLYILFVMHFQIYYCTVSRITKVGSDSTNRNGLGVNVDDVYDLGIDIKFVGWDDDEVVRALCITSAPSDNDLMNFNKSLVAQSGGRLPPTNELQLSYYALSCNHTVWFLKCVAAGLPCSCPTVAVDGVLSLAHIETSDPLFARRVREGINWTVLDWRIRAHYPQLVELLSQARNTGGMLNRRTTAFEVLKQIHSVTAKKQAAGEDVDWVQVRRVVARTKPPCLHILEQLASYVCANSGGPEGIYLDELLKIWKSCGLGSLVRNIPGKLWQALADVAHTDGMPMLRLRNMCVLTCLTAEAGFVEDTYCTFLTEKDIQIFASNKDSVKQRVVLCDRVLNAGFQIISTLAAEDFQKPVEGPALSESQLMLQFGCRVVRFMFSATKSKQREHEQYTSATGIGHDLLVTLRKLSSNTDARAGSALLEQWAPAKTIAERKVGKQHDKVSLVSVGADGSNKDAESLLRQRGFEMGAHIKHKGTSDLWEIVGFSRGAAGLVKLAELPRKLLSTELSPQEFLQKYTRPPSGYESKLLHVDPAWKQREPRDCSAGAFALARADVLAALETAAKLFPDASMSVEPMLNLKNADAGVRAARATKAGGIVLVPWTESIKVTKPKDITPSDYAPWVVEYVGESPLQPFTSQPATEGGEGILPRISLAPCGHSDDKADQLQTPGEKKKSNTALFWRVEGAKAKDKQKHEFNMELGHITVNTLTSIAEHSPSIGGKAARKLVVKSAGKEGPDFSSTARVWSIKIPVLVNNKDVLAGDALTYQKVEVKRDDAPYKPAKMKTNVRLRALMHDSDEEPADGPRKKPRV